MWQQDLSASAERALLAECLGNPAETRPAPPDLKNAMGESEREILERLGALYQNRREFANALGINRSTLWRKLKRYGLTGEWKLIPSRPPTAPCPVRAPASVEPAPR
jgi:DNA-binding NtrC family response regulator